MRASGKANGGVIRSIADVFRSSAACPVGGEAPFWRGALSEMDVPTRTSYVMAVVKPEERPATASITAVPRSLASALSPLLAGYLLSVSAFGWPLLFGGSLKVGYDILLLLRFRHLKPAKK